MPQQTKARWARLKVGVMAIAAMIILGVLIFLLTGSEHPFTARDTIYTYFDDSAALTQSSAVRLNGIVVGRVSKIALSGLNDPNRAVKMDLQIEHRYMPEIPIDSTAKIGAENLLGTKYVNITRGRSPVTIKPGQTLQSEATTDYNDVFEQGNSLLIQLQGILKRVDAIVGEVESGKGSIGKLLVDQALYDRLLATVSEGEKLTAALNSDRGTLGKLVNSDELYNDVRQSMARLDNLLEGLQQGQGTVGHLLKDPALYNDLDKTLLDLRKILADLEAGKGSAGKILKSDELQNEIVGTLRRLDTTLDTINSGKGTIGQLMVNPSLYDTLNGTTRELHGLVRDFRTNPKKFLRIKLGLF